MPYDDREKLKDQVGMLVGLFNSNDDKILKLAKVQLIQLGKSVVPILKVVLDDMRRKQPKYRKGNDQFHRDLREEESEGIRIPVKDLFRRRVEKEGETTFSHSIVEGVLGVLSFFADDTMLQTFSEWLPSNAAVEGLIEIGNESAFSTVIPTLDNLFSSKTEDPFTLEEVYSMTQIDIITKIVAFVDRGVISRFITSYPNLKPGLKELVVGLIIWDKSKNYGNQVLEWMDKGDYEDAKRLSDVVMSLGLNIDPKLSKRLFSKLISKYEEIKSFLEYLISYLEVNDLVGVELDLYLKSLQYYSYPESMEISKFIILRLRKRREDAIQYLTKVLTNKHKDKVKAASWLLNHLTEEAD